MFVNFMIKKCPECGKEFYPATEHIFKDGSKVFCKWSCYNHYMAKKEADKKEREKKRNGTLHGKK